MKETTAYEQISFFLRYLAKKPTFEEVLDYISKHISPDREICGVSLAVLNENGLIEGVMRTGYKIDFPKLTDLHINSNHPAAIALQTQEIQYVDLSPYGNKSNNVPVIHQNTPYKSACQLPINDTLLIALGLEFNYARLKNFDYYFEIIRSSLSMYLALQSKNFFNEFELNGQLTARQKMIYSLINDGKSNREIANELSYSVSLIRQETMRIYAKLGVTGRSELRQMMSSENSVLADPVKRDTNQDQ